MKHWGQKYLVDFLAWSLRRKKYPKTWPPKKILLVRLNRMGDLIGALPLAHALRQAFPQAHLSVATESAGYSIAQCCCAIDQVIQLREKGSRWIRHWYNAQQLQGYDVAIAVKGGFHGWLGQLIRWTNAPIRIGFESLAPGQTSLFYTHALPLPPQINGTPILHQVPTCLRLLEPLGLKKVTPEWHLSPSPEDHHWACQWLQHHSSPHPLILLNISSTSPSLWDDHDYLTLIQELQSPPFSLNLALIFKPTDSSRAKWLAQHSSSTTWLAPCEHTGQLLALIQQAQALITPEGGVAHLAAALDRPALILWWQGPFEKWRSLHPQHLFLRADLHPEQASPHDACQLFHQLLPQLRASTRPS